MSRRETMTPRERMVTAIAHRVPDRVPIDLGGFQTGIHKKAYEALIAHLQIRDDVKTLDPVQQLAVPCEELLQRFHVDTRYVGAHAPDGALYKVETREHEGRIWYDLRDEFGVVWSMPEDQQLFMDITHHPLADATIKDIADYPFPNGGDPTRFTGLRQQTLRLRQETPYAICTYISGVVYEICWYMRGLERWLIDTIENQGSCEALLDQTLKYWIDFESGLLSEIGDLVDVVMIGDDLTGQYGPIFSPEFYRQVVKPRQGRLVRHIKSLTSARVWYHTCGSCRVYLPDLIDNGIDIINPVQISAEQMDPDALKKDFGSRVSFWGGGIDSQHVLPFATPNEIRDHVRRNMEIFMQGGGYVFNNVHNIQVDVPPENIVALYDAAYDYAFYDNF